MEGEAAGVGRVQVDLAAHAAAPGSQEARRQILVEPAGDALATGGGGDGHAVHIGRARTMAVDPAMVRAAQRQAAEGEQEAQRGIRGAARLSAHRDAGAERATGQIRESRLPDRVQLRRMGVVQRGQGGDVGGPDVAEADQPGLPATTTMAGRSSRPFSVQAGVQAWITVPGSTPGGAGCSAMAWCSAGSKGWPAASTRCTP